jgi:hypothetical protein
MTRLRRLTRPQWAVVLAGIVLVAGGITAAALALGSPSRPSVRLRVTNPSPTTPAPTMPAAATPSATQPVTPASPPPATVVAPQPRVSGLWPRPPLPPVHLASPTPSAPGAVEPANCPMNMKCTLPCPDPGSCTPAPTCPPNAMCAQPLSGDVLVITDADNGKTVTVAAASRVSVQLSSTYWTFDPVSNPAVLAAEGPQQTSPCAAKTFPGSGCGIAAVTYAATASGTAVVTAHRSTCGEAMLCTPNQSGFRVTVVVG